MDGAGDNRLGWVIDGLAAAVLGAAIGTCLLLLGQASAGVIGAATGTLVALAGLRVVRPEPRRFRLPAFALEPVPEADELLLTEVADEAPAAEKEDVMLLTDALPPATEDSRVVQLFAARPLPTPGELQRRIAAHLAEPGRPAAVGGGTVLELEEDAAAALRQSLRELRASLG